MFGSKKATAEPYKSDMPLLTSGNQIVVSFDELDGGTDNKYKGKYRITAKKGDVTSEYVVDPNDKSVNKAVVEAIIGKLNGGKGVEPGPPGPSAELKALTDAVDELVAGIADAAKITAATAKISAATAKISAATGAIPEADKSAALAKINAALTPVTGAASGEGPLKSALEEAKKALEAAKSALEPKTVSGYISAKSAVPKRITRIRRTRRLTKRTGTRRRLTR